MKTTIIKFLFSFPILVMCMLFFSSCNNNENNEQEHIITKSRISRFDNQNYELFLTQIRNTYVFPYVVQSTNDDNTKLKTAEADARGAATGGSIGAAVGILVGGTIGTLMGGLAGTLEGAEWGEKIGTVVGAAIGAPIASKNEVSNDSLVAEYGPAIISLGELEHYGFDDHLMGEFGFYHNLILKDLEYNETLLSLQEPEVLVRQIYSVLQNEFEIELSENQLDSIINLLPYVYSGDYYESDICVIDTDLIDTILSDYFSILWQSSSSEYYDITSAFMSYVDDNLTSDENLTMAIIINSCLSTAYYSYNIWQFDLNMY